MLPAGNFSTSCINTSLVVVALLYATSIYAYYVDTKRESDDPKKKNFHPMAIPFVPFTLPALALAWILLFIIKVIFYGIFLTLTLIGIIVIRKPFLLIWLDKIATKVGNKLLEANTLLIRLFFPQLKGRV